MKTASIRDLRNRFPTVIKWIEEGEHVTIMRRGKAFALIAAVNPKKQPKLDWAKRLENHSPIGKGMSKVATEKLWSDLRD